MRKKHVSSDFLDSLQHSAFFKKPTQSKGRFNQEEIKFRSVKKIEEDLSLTLFI